MYDVNKDGILTKTEMRDVTASVSLFLFDDFYSFSKEAFHKNPESSKMSNLKNHFQQQKVFAKVNIHLL